MTDTSPRIERLYREMLLERSGAERLKMGCSMFATARALVLASLREQDPLASAATLRQRLFLRFYGGDFSAGERDRIIAQLVREGDEERSGRPPPPEGPQAPVRRRDERDHPAARRGPRVTGSSAGGTPPPAPSRP